jgi:hypothetical protein
MMKGHFVLTKRFGLFINKKTGFINRFCQRGSIVTISCK